MAVLKFAAATLAAALVMALPAAAQADALQPDAVLDRILAESAKAAPVAFERTTRAELRADPAKEPAIVVDRYSPKSGWTVVSVDGRKPTPKELEDHAKGNSNPPGFQNLYKTFANPPASQSVKNGDIVYHWNSLPKGTVVTPGGDISAKLSADMTVDNVGGKPVLSEVRIYAAKPFKVKIVASINKFNVVSTYKPGANGVPFLTSQTTDTDVSAPMGLGGKRRSTISFKPL